MSKSVLAISLALSALLAPASEEDASLLYPAERAETRAHFFALDGEPDMAKLRNALDALGDGAEIVFGPELSRARSDNYFVVVEADAEVEAKDVSRALKKGKTKPELLQWMLTSLHTPDFRSGGDGRSGGGGRGGGREGNARQLVLGQHGDMRWFEMAKDHAIFFWTGKRLEGEEILESVHKALEPYVPPEGLPAIVRDEFTWTLAAGFKPTDLKRAQRELSKLTGVAEVEADEELGTLTVHIDLADQLASAEPGPWPAPPEVATEETEGRGGEEPDGREGGDDPGGGDPGEGRGGRGGARTGPASAANWFDEHRLVFDRNAALDVLDRCRLHLADPAEGADE